MPFLWKNIANISPVSWWNGYCTNQELSKIAGRLLKLPSTTAAQLWSDLLAATATFTQPNATD